MGSGVRALLVLLVGGGTFLLALVALGVAGLDRVPYVLIPAATFISTVALWPLLRVTLSIKGAHPFANWVAYNAALMLWCGLIMYGATTWMWAQRLLQEYSK